MRNFTGGRGKNTLDYMVRKYESDVYKLGSSFSLIVDCV